MCLSIIRSIVSRVTQYYRLRKFRGPWLVGRSRLWLLGVVSGDNAYLDHWEVTKKYGTFWPLLLFGAPTRMWLFVLICDPFEYHMGQLSGSQKLYLASIVYSAYTTRFHILHRPQRPRHQRPFPSETHDGHKLSLQPLLLIHRHALPFRDNLVSNQSETAQWILRSKMAPGYSGHEVCGLEASVDRKIYKLLALLDGYVAAEKKFESMIRMGLENLLGLRTRLRLKGWSWSEDSERCAGVVCCPWTYTRRGRVRNLTPSVSLIETPKDSSSRQY